MKKAHLMLLVKVRARDLATFPQLILSAAADSPTLALIRATKVNGAKEVIFNMSI